MNVQCFILLEIVVRLHYVVPYTVVLKQVKPLYPPVKIYRYDLRQPKILSDVNVLYPYKPILSQKIYPIRPRGVKKKEAKHVKGLSVDKPFQRDNRLYGISQQLVPPLSNQTEEYSEGKEATEEALKEDVDSRPLPVLPPQEKSFASFGQEKGKIYKSAGEWAVPETNEDAENATQSAFTPSQLYLQIRHKNTVIHVPQSEALKDSETLEELINAPRLKELARTTHVLETYSEEGYEDAAYDHAGQIRQAQHGEIYDAKDEGKFKIKEAPVILNYDSDLEESKRASLKNLKGTEAKANPQEDAITKLEPRVTQSRSELRKTGTEYNKDPPASYKGGHLFSSRVQNKNPLSNNGSESIHSMGPVTFPSFFGEMSLPPDVFTNDSVVAHTKLPIKMSSKYRKEDLNSTKIYPVRPPTDAHSDQFTDFKPFISATDSQPSPSAKSLKYSRIYSKKTKQLRLEPYKTGNVYMPPPPPEHLQPPVEEAEEHVNQQIVLPTIGYINSLTTAHFGKDVSANVREEPKTELRNALNLTQALNYLRSKNNPKSLEEPKIFNETDLKTFESMRLKKQRGHQRNFANKTKRDVYLIKERDSANERSEYEGDDEEDLPHNEKNSEILEDERKRIEEENREKEKFEAELGKEITAKEKEIIKEAFKDIENDSPESFPENFSSESDFHYVKSTTMPSSIDLKKYPFYRSKRLPENSPLRYASDPMTFPRKSGHGMEFYESRERLIQCPDFHPDLDDLPNSNSTKDSDNQEGNNQRLASLGDKIACLRSKYFDPEPFDNPIFKEEEIDYVGKPKKGLKKVIGSQTKHRKTLEAYKKSTTSAPTTKKGTKMSLISKKRPFKTQQISESVMPQHKVNQHLLPTQILPFAPTLKTASSFIKPVNEIPKFSSLATEPQAKVKPPTKFQTIRRPQSTLSGPNKIVLRENCMHTITKLTVLNGANNLTVECNDATFIQEILNGKAYISIIPKERWSAKISSGQSPEVSDWVPIIGYAVPNFTKPVNRKTDEITSPKNETTEKPSSDQYVIDELNEDKNIRQGEVVEDIDHYLKMTDGVKVPTEDVKNEKRKREAIDLKPKKGNHGAQRPTGAVVFDAIEKLTQGQVAVTDKTNETAKTTLSKLFETKRTLGRLSGRDFLTRYHKNKSKPKAADFWKIVTTNKNLQNLEKTTPANSFGKISRERSASDETSEKPMDVEGRKTKLESRNFKDVVPITFVAEKITKKPQTKVLENALQMGGSSENSAKIMTGANKELSESSKKATIVDKKNKSTSVKISKTLKKPEIQYKTINRSKNHSKKLEEKNSGSDSPTLYYVMDVRTGRGKWITNYEERKHSRKFRERGKLR